MGKTKIIILSLAAVYGLALGGGVVYNLLDTLYIEHTVTTSKVYTPSTPYVDSEENSSTEEQEETSSVSSTSQTSQSEAEESSSESASQGGGILGSSNKTTVNYVTDTIKNENGVSTTYHLLDIKLKSITDLRTNVVTDSNGNAVSGSKSLKTTSTQVNERINAGENVVAAINGDSAFYYATNKGYVIRNGNVYRDSTRSGNKDFRIKYDGTVESYYESDTDMQTLVDEYTYQNWCFGPSLIEDSCIVVDSSSEVSKSKGSNERTAIGYLENNHFVFFVSEGRLKTNDGLSLYEMATILKNYGCTFAYNFDGGGTSIMWYGGEVINERDESSERKTSDIVYVVSD
ncbi:MAG: phosphodiester glycosidase family protein [Bacilli bacterium]|nr:phosphodiester glycosidase family protein [Bacilli bacterium]